MKTLNEIKNIIREHRKELTEKYYISEIGIFGSYVRGEQNENSDLDILVEYSPEAKVSLLDRAAVKNYISDLLLIKTDIVRKRSIKKELKENILNEAIYL
ncbi:MAG: nucleotidyltransferase family protein [bacterium]